MGIEAGYLLEYGAAQTVANTIVAIINEFRQILSNNLDVVPMACATPPLLNWVVLCLRLPLLNTQ